MTLQRNVLRFSKLYEGIRRLSGEDLLRDQLNAADTADIKFFAEITCLKHFGHSQPELLSPADAEVFFEQFDPFLSYALEECLQDQ